MTKGRTFIMNSGGSDGGAFGGTGSTDCVIFNGAYGGGRIMYRDAAGTETELATGGGGGGGDVYLSGAPGGVAAPQTFTGPSNTFNDEVVVGTKLSALTDFDVGPAGAPTVLVNGLTGTATIPQVDAATKLATPQLDIMDAAMASAVTEVTTAFGETTFRTPTGGSVHFANTAQDLLSITSNQATFRRPPACLALVGAGAPTYVFDQNLFNVTPNGGGNFTTTLSTDLTANNYAGLPTAILVQITSSTAVGGGAGVDSVFTSVYPTQAGAAPPGITFNNGAGGPADAQGARDNFLSAPGQRYTCSRWRIIFKQVGTLLDSLGNPAVTGFSAYCDIDIDDFPTGGPQILKFKEMQYSSTFNNLITNFAAGAAPSGTNNNVDRFGLVRLGRRPQVNNSPVGYQFFIDFPGWDISQLTAGTTMSLTCQMLKLP